jgi:FMN phosphatase YigB (HAD superfamily)
MTLAPQPQDLPAFLAGREAVVFDMDGTLYRQAPLRLRMAALLAGHVATTADFLTPRVLRDFRRLREEMADRRLRDFDAPLHEECARGCAVDAPTVRRIVSDWIETRPLPHLARCQVAGTAAFFAALRRHGIAIAILSDYPAAAKLEALGLAADVVVAAGDPGVGIMKPDPAGLELVLARLGVPSHRALMIGDRDDRDGAAARLAGVSFLRRGAGGIADFTPRALAAAG